MTFEDTGLPWVMPSPNMPTVDTAFVYPGGCLSKARTSPRGAAPRARSSWWARPGSTPGRWPATSRSEKLPGVAFRAACLHADVPEARRRPCGGVQVHVTDRRRFPAVPHVPAADRTTRGGRRPPRFAWRDPPYEYEHVKRPIDILCGTDARAARHRRGRLAAEARRRGGRRSSRRSGNGGRATCCTDGRVVRGAHLDLTSAVIGAVGGARCRGSPDRVRRGLGRRRGAARRVARRPQLQASRTAPRSSPTCSEVLPDLVRPDALGHRQAADGTRSWSSWSSVLLQPAQAAIFVACRRTEARLVEGSGLPGDPRRGARSSSWAKAGSGSWRRAGMPMDEADFDNVTTITRPQLESPRGRPSGGRAGADRRTTTSCWASISGRRRPRRRRQEKRSLKMVADLAGSPSCTSASSRPSRTWPTWTGSPGLQQALPPVAPHRRDPPGGARQHRLQPDAPRHRPLQELQRHQRPPRGRRGPEADGPVLRELRPRGRRGRALRRRGVRDPLSRARARRWRIGRPRTCAARWRRIRSHGGGTSRWAR